MDRKSIFDIPKTVVVEEEEVKPKKRKKSKKSKQSNLRKKTKDKNTATLKQKGLTQNIVINVGGLNPKKKEPKARKGWMRAAGGRTKFSRGLRDDRVYIQPPKREYFGNRYQSALQQQLIDNKIRDAGASKNKEIADVKHTVKLQKEQLLLKDRSYGSTLEELKRERAGLVASHNVSVRNQSQATILGGDVGELNKLIDRRGFGAIRQLVLKGEISDISTILQLNLDQRRIDQLLKLRESTTSKFTKNKLYRYATGEGQLGAGLFKGEDEGFVILEADGETVRVSKDDVYLPKDVVAERFRYRGGGGGGEGGDLTDSTAGFLTDATEPQRQNIRTAMRRDIISSSDSASSGSKRARRRALLLGDPISDIDIFVNTDEERAALESQTPRGRGRGRSKVVEPIEPLLTELPRVSSDNEGSVDISEVTNDPLAFSEDEEAKGFSSVEEDRQPQPEPEVAPPPSIVLQSTPKTDSVGRSIAKSIREVLTPIPSISDTEITIASKPISYKESNVSESDETDPELIQIQNLANINRPIPVSDSESDVELFGDLVAPKPILAPKPIIYLKSVDDTVEVQPLSSTRRRKGAPKPPPAAPKATPTPPPALEPELEPALEPASPKTKPKPPPKVIKKNIDASVSVEASVEVKPKAKPKVSEAFLDETLETGITVGGSKGIVEEEEGWGSDPEGQLYTELSAVEPTFRSKESVNKKQSESYSKDGKDPTKSNPYIYIVDDRNPVKRKDTPVRYKKIRFNTLYDGLTDMKRRQLVLQMKNGLPFNTRDSSILNNAGF